MGEAAARRGRLGASLLLAAALCAPAPLRAQHEAHDGGRRVGLAWGAQAVPLLTHAAPAIDGRALTEAYLTQPNLMAHLSALDGRLRVVGTLNLEGLTLRRGELTPGAWGEGYFDRRHPHTYLHELVAIGRVAGGPDAAAELTLALGKGFAPFGTDDPMTRPFVKFPVNHHLAQVLERAVGIAALRVGPAVVEAGLFSGDEPTSASHVVTPARFGDSWAVRGTLLPRPGLEASASYADVASPEHAAGSGIDHRKASAALRYEAGAPASRRYALVEWARTRTYIVDEPSFAFTSWLAEAAAARGPAEIALRYERTTRPEEERAADPFRSPVPHKDVHLLGVTRWDIVAVALSRELRPGRWLGARLHAEAAHARVAETLGSPVFVPADWYGADRLWNLSVGVRLAAGARHARMGRYGAAVAEPRADDPHAAHRRARRGPTRNPAPARSTHGPSPLHRAVRSAP